MEKDLVKNKYSFYAYSLDDREINSSIGGFSEFMIEVIKEVNLIFGDYYFSDDEDILKIYLTLDCNNFLSDNLKKGTKANEIQYVTQLNFDEVVKRNFEISFFGEVIKSIIYRIIIDLNLGEELSDKLDALFIKLIKDERLKYKKHDSSI